MTNIIEHTYKELANTGELRLTEKDYSTNYLDSEAMSKF